MNKTRKVSSIILSSILVLIMGVNVLAEGNINIPDHKFSIEEEYVELFLKEMGNPSTVSMPVTLSNIKGEQEAVCFTIDNGGYIIINTNDLSISELSFKASTPFKKSTEKYVYNGPLQYYEVSNGEYKSLTTNNLYNEKSFEVIYTKEKVDKIKILDDKKVANIVSSSSQKSGGTTVYLSDSLLTWYVSGGLCGPISGAICMMYYNDNVSTAYVAAGDEVESKLINIMNTYMDVDGNGSTNTTEVVNGLNDFLDDRSVSTNVYSTSSFSFTTVKSKINNDRPVIVDTDNSPIFREHWIIAHGYYDSLSDDFIIVNNGWGDNDVWVATDGYLDDIVYFSN